jgi:hypothetical protein
VQTGPELGDQIGVRAIAFDAASAFLWLHGTSVSGQGRLLSVDPSGEPDVLLAGFDLDAFLTGLAFDGTSLWAVNFGGQSIVRIDPVLGPGDGQLRDPGPLRAVAWDRRRGGRPGPARRHGHRGPAAPGATPAP